MRAPARAMRVHTNGRAKFGNISTSICQVVIRRIRCRGSQTCSTKPASRFADAELFRMLVALDGGLGLVRLRAATVFQAADGACGRPRLMRNTIRASCAVSTAAQN